MRTLMIAVAALLAAEGAAAQGRQLQVLKEVPESQLFLVMNAVAASLGVRCEHCHVRDTANPSSGIEGWHFERNDKPAKAKGLEMMRLVREINRTRYDGRPVVTCFTCHRGELRVGNRPPQPPREIAAAAPPAAVALPSAADVMQKYIAAVGGADASTRFATLVMEGRDERPEGARRGDVRMSFKGSDRFRVDLRLPPDFNGAQGVVGATGWSASPAPRALAPEDVARLRRNSARYAPIKVLDAVAALRVDRIESVRGRDTYAVVASVDTSTTRTYFFDASTGLLVRLSTTTTTPIVLLQEQVEYDDYRSVDGIMLPFVVRSSDDAPYDTSTRTFTKITHGVPLDDALFAIPQGPIRPPLSRH